MKTTVFFSKKVLLVAFAALSLTGCKQILSNVLTGPDEMAVVDSAPLTLPPNFDLRPPRPNTLQNEEAQQALIEAESLITGEDVTAVETATSTVPAAETSEEWFFEEVTANEAAAQNAAAQNAATEATTRTVPEVPEKGFFQRTFSKK